jgi:hypothetical protein
MKIAKKAHTNKSVSRTIRHLVLLHEVLKDGVELVDSVFIIQLWRLLAF